MIITASQAGNAYYHAAPDVEQSFSVARAEAVITLFDSGNPVAVRVAADGGRNSAFTWQAKLTRANDGNPGDLSLIRPEDITLTFSPVGGGGGYSIKASRYETGIATFNISAGELGVETYTGTVTLDNNYFTAYPDEDVLVVYDPSLGFTTGGGWFYWPQDGSGPAGAKTNFGYTMKYNKQGKNIQGNLLVIAHLEDGSIYRIKSNALDGLALGSTGNVGWASFSGKCTYTFPVPDGDPVTRGGQEFMVYVTGSDTLAGVKGTFWFTVLGQPFTLDKNGDRQAAGESQTLQGGNIFVPHTPGAKK